jgi:hypothetical protein
MVSPSRCAGVAASTGRGGTAEPRRCLRRRSPRSSSSPGCLAAATRPPHATPSACFASAQLFRVNVFLQQQTAGAQAAQQTSDPASASLASDAPPFFVLRRYSQFRHLYDEVRCGSGLPRQGPDARARRQRSWKRPSLWRALPASMPGWHTRCSACQTQVLFADTAAASLSPLTGLRRGHSQPSQLKAAFPAVMAAKGMAPPPKHPLVLGLGADRCEPYVLG